MSGRSEIASTLALAGGQDEQPWLWNSSTTVGWAASAARAGAGAIISAMAASAARALTYGPVRDGECLFIGVVSVPDAGRGGRVRGEFVVGLPRLHRHVAFPLAGA